MVVVAPPEKIVMADERRQTGYAGLLMLVNKRRSLLDYLRGEDEDRRGPRMPRLGRAALGSRCHSPRS